MFELRHGWARADSRRLTRAVRQDERLRVMEGEMRTANAEYKVAVQTAGEGGVAPLTMAPL